MVEDKQFTRFFDGRSHWPDTSLILFSLVGLLFKVKVTVQNYSRTFIHIVNGVKLINKYIDRRINLTGTPPWRKLENL